ncbi:MAG: hypothetical protein KA712_14305 [Myxococcales bacterium]|nr:hypothetical protein [Myxococcales bacterium]
MLVLVSLGLASCGRAEPPAASVTGADLRFSFFATSQTGLISLAPGPEGFGGNLGGLAGADALCTTLASRGAPGNRKTWRAFLSVAAGDEGAPVHAIDRIGPGPWYDFRGRLLAATRENLIDEDHALGRPRGGDPALAVMFTDEGGDPISPDPLRIDNHDFLTGSDERGQLYGDEASTCLDWTSANNDDTVPPLVGHAWPRSATSGRHWIAAHVAGGCAAGINVDPTRDFEDESVGAGGGYGGIYCFALSE